MLLWTLVLIVAFNIYVGNVIGKRKQTIDLTKLPKNEFVRQMKARRSTQLYYYNEFGDLILNGSVPGTSTPIVLDRKQYNKKFGDYYTSNVYFFFTFAISKEDECPDGLTICYEGQLSGDHVKDEFWVPNLSEDEAFYAGANHSWYIGKDCMDANDGIATVHGLRISVRMAKIKFDEKNITTRVFEIASSIFTQKHLYLVPPDGKMVLQIGARYNMETRVTNVNNEDLGQVEEIRGDEVIATVSHGAAPDLNRQQKWFRESRGLWLLYPDFKRSHREMQIIQSVHTENCLMTVRIRGNRMQKCRAFFEDIAVTESVNTTLEMAYTYMVGSVRKQKQGWEESSERRKRKERADLKTKGTKTGSEHRTETANKTETEDQSTHSKEEHDEKRIKGYYEAKLAGDLDKYKELGGYQDFVNPKKPYKNGTGGERERNALIPDLIKEGATAAWQIGSLVAKEIRRHVNKEVKPLVGNGIEERVREEINVVLGASFIEKIKRWFSKTKEIVNERNFLHHSTLDSISMKIEINLTLIVDGFKNGLLDEKLMVVAKGVKEMFNLDEIMRKIGEQMDTFVPKITKSMDGEGGKLLNKIVEQSKKIAEEFLANMDGSLINNMVELRLKQLIEQTTKDFFDFIKTLLWQQLQKMIGQGAPLLVGNKIQHNIHAELDNQLNELQTLFWGDQTHKVISRELEDFVKKIPDQLPGYKMKLSRKQLKKTIGSESQNLVESLKGFMDEQLNIEKDQIVKNFEENQLQKLFSSDIEDVKQLKIGNIELVGEIENWTTNLVGGSVSEELKSIPVDIARGCLDELLKKKMDSLHFADVKKWIIEEAKIFTNDHRRQKIRREIKSLLDKSYPKMVNLESGTVQSMKYFLASKLRDLIVKQTSVFVKSHTNKLLPALVEQMSKFISDDKNKLNKYIDNVLEREIGGPIQEEITRKIESLTAKKLSYEIGELEKEKDEEEEGGEGLSLKMEYKLRLEAGHTWGERNGSVNQERSYDKTSTRAFKGVTKENSLMSSFKSTHIFASSMTSSTFVQSSLAFSNKEIVDIRVSNIPPNKMIVITQLMFECDGNIIRLPQLYFHDGVEELDVQQHSMSGKASLMMPDEMKKGGKKVTTDNSTMAKQSAKREVYVSPMNVIWLNGTAKHAKKSVIKMDANEG